MVNLSKSVKLVQLELDQNVSFRSLIKVRKRNVNRDLKLQFNIHIKIESYLLEHMRIALSRVSFVLDVVVR